jgi:hypothetical protein
MTDQILESNKIRWRLVGWGFLCLILLGLFLVPKIDKNNSGAVREEILSPSDEEKIIKENVFKAYFVAGILHRDVNSKKFKESLENELRGYNEREVGVDIFDSIFYVHSDYQRSEEIIADIKSSLDKDYKEATKRDKKILIFAHSWGGILAKTAVNEFLIEARGSLSNEIYTKLKNSIVLVTMATPHTMTYGSANIAKIHLATPENIKDIKIFTFGGIFDIIVPVKFTHIKDDKGFAKNTFAREVRATHMMFLNSPRVHKKIFKGIFK